LSADEYLERGLSLYEQGEYELSMAAFGQAIALEPWLMTDVFILHQSARMSWDAMQPIIELDAQIAELDRAIEENPEDAEAYYERGRLKYSRTWRSGEPIEQQPLFEDSDNVNVIGGTITNDSLNLESAIADFDQAIAINPEYATAYHMRGLAYHLQGLEYIGIALVDCFLEDFEQAIDDYDRAIALDPELSVAYHDRGVAVAQQVRFSDEPIDDPASELDRAIRDLTVAIEGNPDSAALYINRAFVQTMLGYQLDGADNSTSEIAQAIFDDASRAIELAPEQPWPYLYRILAAYVAMDIAKDQDLFEEWEPTIEQDNETFDRLAEDVTMQYMLEDIVTRILTLSEGPPIEPETRASEAFGQFEAGKYTSPDGSFELDIPDLMQPNAVMSDELTTSGDLLVWFQDDLARQFSFQAHPGPLGDARLIDWVEENFIQYLDVEEVSEADSQHGPMIFVEYRLDEPEASCALAVFHAEETFYSALYCLLDHYMGEDDRSGGIRLFAEFRYEPTDLLLEQFLQGVKLHGQPVLTSS
jgi:tetratricopeptide (TPR) repeat protein